MAQPQATDTFDFAQSDAAIDFAHIDADPEHGLKSSAPWTWAGVRSNVWRWSQKWGHRWDDDMEDFVLSWPGIGNTEEEDAKWECVNVLGRGGFGIVGHWQKRDSSDAVINEIAIKQNPTHTFKREMKMQFWQPANQELPKEAVCTIEVQPHTGNVVNLRRLKVYQSHRGVKDIWRMYFEYCPYGDLSTIMKRYNRWNAVYRTDLRSIYFPEEFLWHIFHQLAYANLAMATGPFRDGNTGAIVPGIFYLHEDIKPQNILLGNPDPNAIFPVYPTLKVGDWGMAVKTSDSDPKNPHHYLDRGTRMYFAPEQRANYPTPQRRRVMAGLEPPPLWAGISVLHTNRGVRHQMNPNMNTWAFGAVIHDMMTLNYHNDTLNAAMQTFMRDQRVTAALGFNLIPPISTQKPIEYSQELRMLVRACLNISPVRRPSPAQLFSSTSIGSTNCLARLASLGREPEPVVLEGDMRPPVRI